MARFVRKPVHTKVYDRISGGSDHEGVDAPLGHNNRSGQRPRLYVHPGIGRSRSR